MNLPTILITVTWMVRDTIRQSIAAKLFWVLLAGIVLCILFCLSVHVKDTPILPLGPGEVPEMITKEVAIAEGKKILVDKGIDILAGGAAVMSLAEQLGKEKARKNGVDIPEGSISLAFGLVQLNDHARDKTDAVRFLQIWLAGVIADTAGIFLALIWTAGFLPTFLEPASVTVLLAKPIPRWAILFGKFLGVMIFVSAQVILFVGGTWLALGIRTGVFDGLYLLAIPMMIIHFGIFFSFSVLMAVWSRNTTVSLLTTLFLWIVCWGMNFGWVIVSIQNFSAFPPTSRFILDAGYWILPKPLDLDMVLYDVLKADGFTMKIDEFKKLQELKLFRPELSILASSLFGLVMLVFACREFEKQEY